MEGSSRTGRGDQTTSTGRERDQRDRAPVPRTGCGHARTCAWSGYAFVPWQVQHPMQSAGGVDCRTARTRRRPHATEGVPGRVRVQLGRGPCACDVTPAKLSPMTVLVVHSLLWLSAPRTLFWLFSRAEPLPHAPALTPAPACVYASSLRMLYRSCMHAMEALETLM